MQRRRRSGGAIRDSGAAAARRLAVLLALAVPAALPVSSAAADLEVTVTIKPVHALVAGVMEGIGTPVLLVRGAASPHTYALRPSDAKALHTSDVFFRTSAEVEPFTAKVIAALPKSVRVVTLSETPGLELLDVRTAETFERHHHDGADHHRDGHHDHGGTGHGHAKDEHHGHARRDGHIWLDPENARRMVDEITRVLAEAAPEHAETLKRNAGKVTADLEALEDEIRADLAPVKDRPFVVFHDAYQYFERRFGLNAVGSITVSPDVQPSARRLTAIRRKIEALGAACVFAEPQFNPKLVTTVIEGMRARSGTLDPEGALLEPGPGAYATLLRNLASGLKNCLSAGS